MDVSLKKVLFYCRLLFVQTKISNTKKGNNLPTKERSRNSHMHTKINCNDS